MNSYRYFSTFNKSSRIITQDKSQGASQAMFYALGMKDVDMKKGQIGIGSNWFESNPCNNHLNILSSKVKESINKRENLIGFCFNTIGVSDGQTNGHSGMNFSLPSRDLIADSYESVVKAHLYDGNIAIPGCDKNIPGCLMGMISINKPSFMIYGGSIKPGVLNNKRIDIVDAFQSYGNYIKDNDNKKRENIIKNACPGSGSCGGMYTANTMGSAFEALGITLPKSSSNPALSPEKIEECEKAGETIEILIKNDIKPLDIINKKSMENAITTVIALGGSTNAVLHLLAIAKTANIDLNIDDFNRIGRKVPIIGNLKPMGDYLMNDIHIIGGTPVVLKILQEMNLLYDDCLTITGKTIKENLQNVSYNRKDIDHILKKDSKQKSHIRILYGNLSPKGCVAKISGKEGEYFKGTAIVFESENHFMEYLKTNKINTSKKIVFVIRNQGPKGGPGMPEMLKPTSAIIGMGIKDNVAFITDGRFSGGSHGFIVGHVSPEAYEGGPISKVNNGDLITIDTVKNEIIWEENLFIDKIHVKKQVQKIETSNYLKKYIKLVSGAEEGCITFK
jgi:dihydroxy-acid dehydratase